MTRNDAVLLCRKELAKHDLIDWHVRLDTNANSRFLALCLCNDKCIIINAHHIDIHPDAEILNTIRHEIAHALTPGHAHDEVWASKAREIGCDNTLPCSHLGLSPHIIDAIRSGSDVQVTFEEQVIRTPKYQITRLQDKCKFCGKVAIEESRKEIGEILFIKLQCGHTLAKQLPKKTPFHEMTSTDGKKPYPFQVEGARFIESALTVGKGAAIFDEMGLGKTIQVLTYLKFHPEAFPVLFVIKSGIKYQWFKEVIRWLGNEYVGQVIQTTSDYIIPGLKTYFVSYDAFVMKSRNIKGKIIESGMPIEKFIERGIKTIVLDECQQIKNPDTSRTKAIRGLVKAAEHVIPLSGTPWKNRGSEFYTVLNMIDPRRFWSYKAFVSRWVDTYYDMGKEKEGGIRNPAEFREYIKDIAIRRERKEVMPELPSISRNLQYTQLDKVTQTTYDDVVSDFVKSYNEKVISGEDPFGSFGDDEPIIAQLARMRHLTGLSKIPDTIQFVEEFIEETDRKLVIFVHHKDVGSILYEKLKKQYGATIPVMKLEGGMDSARRFEIQEAFNRAPRALLVASTLASGEGLNLQTAADCILHERQWNPANEEQAEGRFIRIGQTSNAVIGTYMTAAGTVDEQLAGIVERKRLAFHAAMNQGEMPVWNQKDIIRELTETIVNDWNKKNKANKQKVS